jgi:hypothetical protein
LNIESLERRRLCTYTFTEFKTPGYGGEATSINNAGRIVGSYDDLTNHGLLRGFEKISAIGSDFTTINFPNAYYSGASGINDLNQIVGDYQVEDKSTDKIIGHGYLLYNGVYYSIDVPGAVGTDAAGINNKGQVVGTYNTIKSVGVLQIHGYLKSGDS